MNIYELVEGLNDIIWILPILRQYKSRYFYYFFILGITDLVNNILYRTLLVNPLDTYLFASYVLLLSIIEIKRKLKIVDVIGYLLFCGLFLFSTEDAALGVFVFHAIIFYHLVDIFMHEIFIEQVINSFIVILLLYEATILLKLGVFLINPSTGIIYFYIATTFTTIIAIYFIIYRKETAFKIMLSNK